MPNYTLTYNSRTTALDECVDTSTSSSSSYSCSSSGKAGPLHDPTALIFVHDGWLNYGDQDYVGGVDIPDLPILRAAAGECILIKLTNDIFPDDLPGYNLLPNIIDKFNANELMPSGDIGLHPQLVAYDVTRSDGTNVGFNPVNTLSFGQSGYYQWYAGQWVQQPDGSFNAVPTEFGAINLTSADPIKHSNKGLVAGLVVEPEDATWQVYSDEGVVGPEAEVTHPGGTFREYVTLFRTDVNLRYADNSPVHMLPVSEDPAETGQNAVNFKTEPVWFRLGILPQTDPGVTRQIDMSGVFSNAQVGGDPETPVFTDFWGKRTRFRVLNPAGHSQQNVFAIHGQAWEEFPYINQSTELDRDANPYSQWVGSQFGHGPSNHFDALLKDITPPPGDYMWRDMVPWSLSSGIWGILRPFGP